MATNNKRRETTRRQLERQLKERQDREARRKRATLIGSVVGSIVVIVVIVVVLIVALDNSGSDKKKTSAAGAPTTSAANTTAASGGACTGGSVSFQGVTVGCATDLTHQPKVTSKSSAKPKTLQYKDLVVGKGKAASPSSTVTVQYTGALYTNGTIFDSSWASAGAKPVSFSLAKVVPGFKQGIGGVGKIPPMKIGGRRLMILPSALAYGANPPSASIPANSTLVFVVDLTKVA